MIFLIGAAIIFSVFFLLRGRSVEEKLAEHKQAAENFVRDFAAKRLPQVRTSVVLKPGEKAYHVENDVKLYETLMSSVGLAIGSKIGRFIVAGHNSIPREKLLQLDEGSLTITNRRLVFSGRFQQRIIPLTELGDIVSHLDYFSISSEHRDKKSLFQVSNPTLWQMLIRNSANGNMEKVLREGLVD